MLISTKKEEMLCPIQCLRRFPGYVQGGEKKTWRQTQTLVKPIPFSYKLCHLFLHLLPLQLFVQQDLKACEAPVALAVLLVRLPHKHKRKHSQQT